MRHILGRIAPMCLPTAHLSAIATMGLWVAISAAVNGGESTLTAHYRSDNVTTQQWRL